MLKKLFALLLVLVLLAVTFAAAETAEPIVEKKTIAPFTDLTWEDIALYGEEARNMTAVLRNAGPWEYNVIFTTFSVNALGGIINTTDATNLPYIWLTLNEECIHLFSSCKENSTPIAANELMGYTFQNEQTYMTLSYVDSTNSDYIFFVLIKTAQ